MAPLSLLPLQAGRVDKAVEEGPTATHGVALPTTPCSTPSLTPEDTKTRGRAYEDKGSSECRLVT